MVLHQYLAKVRQEAPSATGPALRYVLSIGAVSQADFDAVGNRIYEDRHVAEFIEYLRTPRRRGRKPQVAATTG